MATVDRFNDGEPVDIVKLNQIVDAITDLNKKNPNLSSSTVSYTPEVWAGKVTVKTGSKAGAVVEAGIDYSGAKFEGVPFISLTPQINTSQSGNYVNTLIKSSTKDVATISVAGYGKILEKNVVINFVAVYMKPTS